MKKKKIVRYNKKLSEQKEKLTKVKGADKIEREIKRLADKIDYDKQRFEKTKDKDYLRRAAAHNALRDDLKAELRRETKGAKGYFKDKKTKRKKTPKGAIQIPFSVYDREKALDRISQLKNKNVDELMNAVNDKLFQSSGYDVTYLVIDTKTNELLDFYTLTEDDDDDEDEDEDE